MAERLEIDGWSVAQVELEEIARNVFALHGGGVDAR